MEKKNAIISSIATVLYSGMFHPTIQEKLIVETLANLI